MCSSEAESVGHALWRCVSAQAVWCCCQGPIQKSSVAAEEFIDFFDALCDRLEDTELEGFVSIAHKIWIRLNRVVFGGAVLPPTVLIKQALELVEDFRKTQVGTVELGQGELTSNGRWYRPTPNSIKINWDAALDGRKKLMGVGIIARDCQGVVKAAMCDDIPYIRDPIIAKAIAARCAVLFGRNLGFDSVDLEGDAREIILALEKTEDADSIHGFLLEETRQILESLPSWRVSHVRREGNTVAHLLAKFALSQQSQRVWLNSCPSMLVNAVNADIY
jgi:hypothetical protein